MKTNKSQNTLLAILATALLVDAILWWPAQPNRDVYSDYSINASVLPFSSEYTQPIPQNLKFDADKVALGRKLFNDNRLSVNDTIACSSCHVLEKGGADNLVHSIGINGAEGNINAPTVFNSGFNFVQFWDGRAATLEDQIDGPVTNPKEMGSTWTQVLKKLEQDTDYRADFSKTYDGDISVINIKDAIATFERSLVTPDSRFDQYLRGNAAALSPMEARGYELFQSYGCIACHQGVNLGGNMYERMGLMDDYFGDRGNVTEADQGHFNVTKKDAHRHYFRVPSLRNVALTAPYFHDGSAKTLPDAVKVMVKYQLGRTMPENDLSDIVAFLNSLTGEYEGRGL